MRHDRDTARNAEVGQAVGTRVIYRPRLYTEGDDPELVGLPARPGVDLTMPDLRGALLPIPEGAQVDP